MVTIKDIAARAGVSIAAVSMALNGKGCIPESTRKRIASIAKDMKYVPSASAKALKTRRTQTLGLVVGNLGNPYFTDIITAAEESARSCGYNIFICDAGLSTSNAVDCFQALNARGVDGILFSLSLNIDDAFREELELLKRNGVKLVALTPCVDDPAIPVVSFAGEEEVKCLVRRLVSLGHRRIGAIAGPRGSWLNEKRFKSFTEVLEAEGLRDDDAIVHSSLSVEDGRAKALDLLRRRPDITALYGINDMVALGALQAARDLGLSVPGDLSIAGSDGIPVIWFTSPVITTIVTPRSQMGRMATERLINIIEGREEARGNNTFLPCTVEDGASVAAPGRPQSGGER